ncbi:MAG: aspartate kinase [Chloroflexi bacterium]|nr:aspartate kinase [Chloroflexota bacterium]MCI0578167.1 aspartate kinase [Chloroflexota bacterium]MCI0649667.1 aspartate kinase [Chloroflexota bacterium]MCI0731227.1 aspartate kinase [Chloroflexota bacterium]
MTLVMKFGGTSVGSAEAMERTAGLVRRSLETWPQVVVVASAMNGITDLLLQGARTAAAGQATYQELAQTLQERHHQAIEGLLPAGEERERLAAEIDRFVDRFAALCRAVLVLGELTPRALDAISSMGEQMSIRILAAHLRYLGQPAEAVDASELVVTDNNFQSATPLMGQTTAQTEARLRPLLARGAVPVVTGFIGATVSRVTTTLGRGGSDYSAAILGQALQAKEVWIWTDVDGVMTADPRLVAEARTIPVLSYREVAELAYYGAKVLHPKTIRPCVENNIPLRIKNTFNPNHPGTVIVPEVGESNGKIKAVTAIKKLSLITIEGKGMIGVPGIAARTFGAVARGRVSVLLITQASSEQSICFTVPEEVSDPIVAGLEEEFAVELRRRDIDRVWAERPVAIITVVGAGMRGTPGIAGRLFSAVGQAGVNIIAIAQGSSECSVSMVVAEPDTAAAEKAIHSLIVNGD